MRLVLCWAKRKYALQNGAGGRVLAPRAGGGPGRSADGFAPFLSPLHFLEGLGSLPKRDRTGNQPVFKTGKGAAAPRLEGSIPSPLRSTIARPRSRAQFADDTKQTAAARIVCPARPVPDVA
jgi:hypothetical protein